MLVEVAGWLVWNYQDGGGVDLAFFEVYEGVVGLC